VCLCDTLACILPVMQPASVIYGIARPAATTSRVQPGWVGHNHKPPPHPPTPHTHTYTSQPGERFPYYLAITTALMQGSPLLSLPASLFDYPCRMTASEHACVCMQSIGRHTPACMLVVHASPVLTPTLSHTPSQRPTNPTQPHPH
jgi:hypothetical protein